MSADLAGVKTCFNSAGSDAAVAGDGGRCALEGLDSCSNSLKREGVHCARNELDSASLSVSEGSSKLESPYFRTSRRAQHLPCLQDLEVSVCKCACSSF